jgi:hypothetical protein
MRAEPIMRASNTYEYYKNVSQENGPPGRIPTWRPTKQTSRDPPLIISASPCKCHSQTDSFCFPHY